MSLVAWIFVAVALVLLVVAPFTACRARFMAALVFVLAYSVVPVIGVTS